MSARSGEYRRQAAHCEARAKEARDPRHAEEYRRMAAEWVRMAEQAERDNW